MKVVYIYMEVVLLKIFMWGEFEIIIIFGWYEIFWLWIYVFFGCYEIYVLVNEI